MNAPSASTPESGTPPPAPDAPATASATALGVAEAPPRIPPPVLILMAITAIQVGAGLAIHLFPVLGADGTVAVRIIFSAVLLALAARGGVFRFAGLLRRHFRLLVPFGLCIGAMNLFFYLSLDRIPLGAAVAIEFIGPLGVAALNARRAAHLAWVGLAAVGIVLLSPFSGADLDPAGVVYALLAGAGWALFIVLAGRVGRQVPGNDGLAIGMAVAAVAMIPFVVPVVDTLVTQPLILLAGLAVALLSTTLPFTFEFKALKHLPPRAYGVLVALEPGVALVVGALLLDERVGAQGVIAVACVIVAALGITLMDRRPE